jgi:RNA polymerase sigma-54 factor
MRFETGQYQQQQMSQKLTPRMIQSMQILQLPALALEERIEEELTNNPTLDMAEPADVDVDAIAAQQEQAARDSDEGERELSLQDDSVDPGHADDFERLANISEQYRDDWSSNNYEGESFRPRRDSGERDAKMDAMSNTAARARSLTDQLMDQWHLVDNTDRMRLAGDCLIELIDKNGFMRADEHTLSQQLPPELNLEDANQALARIQSSIEPVGIGARNLHQCLSLQIDAKLRQIEAQSNGHPNGDSDHHLLLLAKKILDHHFKDLEGNRMPKIAEALGCDLDQLKAVIDLLAKLYRRPGQVLAPDTSGFIRPDAVVEFDEVNDQYIAALITGRFPSLQIRPEYREMARDKSEDRKTRDYVKQHMQSARWLLDAIEQRENTLLRVIKVVIEAQREFLDNGPQFLKPLPMTGVADQLGIHVATVSRAVSEKYIETPRGILPLRMFFSGGTETESGQSMSWSAVQAKLKEIIAEENKSKPLSDDALVVKLKETGIEIARRTVAKYRKEMEIPAARQRKQY